MKPKLTVVALYNYDNSIFDTLTVPQGVDKPALIDLILCECADFNTVYPDPVMFKARVGAWSVRRLPIWERLLSTTTYEYNPINNYDRTETITESIDRTGTDSTQSTVTHTGTDSTQTNASAAHTGTVQTAGNYTDTESNTAFNSDTFADASKLTHAGTTTDTNNLTDTTSGTGTRTLNLSDSNAGTRTLNLNDSTEKEIHAVGNIGITTTQQMIEQERDVVRFDIYQEILYDYINAFCVQVY